MSSSQIPALLEERDILVEGWGKQANGIKAERRKTLLNVNNSKIFLKGTRQNTWKLSGKPHY